MLQVFIARLVFILVFEHLVFLITRFLAYLIPEVPNSLSRQMAREQVDLRNCMIHKERNRTREEVGGGGSLTTTSPSQHTVHTVETSVKSCDDNSLNNSTQSTIDNCTVDTSTVDTSTQNSILMSSHNSFYTSHLHSFNNSTPRLTNNSTENAYFNSTQNPFDS